MDACVSEEECAHEAMQKCKVSNAEKLNEKEIEKWMKILWRGWLFFFLSFSSLSRKSEAHFNYVGIKVLPFERALIVSTFG